MSPHPKVRGGRAELAHQSGDQLQKSETFVLFSLKSTYQEPHYVPSVILRAREFQPPARR